MNEILGATNAQRNNTHPCPVCGHATSFEYCSAVCFGNRRKTAVERIAELESKVVSLTNTNTTLQANLALANQGKDIVKSERDQAIGLAKRFRKRYEDAVIDNDKVTDAWSVECVKLKRQLNEANSSVELLTIVNTKLKEDRDLYVEARAELSERFRKLSVDVIELNRTLEGKSQAIEQFREERDNAIGATH